MCLINRSFATLTIIMMMLRDDVKMMLRAVFKYYLSSGLKNIPFYISAYPSGIHLFKINNGDIGATCKICSKLTIIN